MRDVKMIGFAPAFTVLLLVSRSLFFPGRGGQRDRLSLMNRPDTDDNQHDSDSSKEGPSVIGTEQDSTSQTGARSDEKRIELAVMRDRIIRMLP